MIDCLSFDSEEGKLRYFLLLLRREKRETHSIKIKEYFAFLQICCDLG